MSRSGLRRRHLFLLWFMCLHGYRGSRGHQGWHVGSPLDPAMCEASDGGPSVWRRIVVTGANKGIGLAICRKLLTDAEDTFVYLGARDQNRGDAAAKTLVEANPVWGGRVAVLLVDVTNAASVQSAAATLRVAGATCFRLRG